SAAPPDSRGGRSRFLRLQTSYFQLSDYPPILTYPRSCRLTIVVIAQRSTWTSGRTSLGSTFLPSSPCPQTRSSTPACLSSCSIAMFGLLTPLWRALYTSLVNTASPPP